ncbi:Uncharacterised protein [Mycobacteroides abscessus subsp. abscessus]|nr:Uncharacterised protein [Mycobacteroides abscessus subsp. abscessus]
MTKADFLRLHLMLLMSTEAADAEVGAMIDQVRHDGRRHFHRMIAQAFLIEGADIAQMVADELDHFGMAGFDGAASSPSVAAGRDRDQPSSRRNPAAAARSAAT